MESATRRQNRSISTFYYGTRFIVPCQGGATEHDLSGTAIGNYLLLRSIGKGGMGEVYEARHSILGHSVAIKVLLPHVSRDAEVVQPQSRSALATATRAPMHTQVFPVAAHAPVRAAA